MPSLLAGLGIAAGAYVLLSIGFAVYAKKRKW